MGYLATALKTGIEIAEKYDATKYINKARSTSTTLDSTVAKLDTLLREQGAPIMTKLDTKLDSTVAMTQEKTMIIKKRITDSKLRAVEAKAELSKKVEAKAGEAKATISKKALEAATTSKKQFTEIQSKASSSKTFAEKKLLSSACVLDAKTGKPYAGKAAAYAVKTTDTAIAYGMDKATMLLDIATALPTALTKKTQSYVDYTKDTTAKAKAFVFDGKAKFMLFLVTAKVQLMAMPTTLLKKTESYKVTADAKVYYTKAVELTMAKVVIAKTMVETTKAKVMKMEAYGKAQTFLKPYLEKATAKTAEAKAYLLKQEAVQKVLAKVTPYFEKATAAKTAPKAATTTPKTTPKSKAGKPSKKPVAAKLGAGADHDLD